MGLEELRRIREQRDLPKKKKAYKIPKKSAKKLKQEAEHKEVLKKDEEFYKEVWAASPHKCQNCDCKLPKTPYNWMFHHLLEKRNYPQYRHTPENIMILCLECHSKAETGMINAPKIHERWQKAHADCHKWNQD